jgi:hypothetical protein
MVKHLIQKLILSSKRGKWAFSLVEYDLVYEPLRAARGQAIADFITVHDTELGETCMVEACSWQLFFDGLVCEQGNGVSYMVVSPYG